MSTFGKIRYIKIAIIDGNGNNITDTLESLSTIILPLSTGNKEYKILNRSRFNTHFLYYVEPSNVFNIPSVDRHSPNYNMEGTITNYKYP